MVSNIEAVARLWREPGVIYLGSTPHMTILDWLLDSDPAIRWQVLRDLADAPPGIVAAQRARVATAASGWCARILALQGDDGQWEGGALFPAVRDRSVGQPWTATAYSLVLLQDCGVDPHDDAVRRAVARVKAHCRWEHAGQPFFNGEVEPCINGMTVSLGAYFEQDVDDVVDRLVSEQLEDGGWNCEVENGSVRSSFHTTIRVLEGLLAYERATGDSPAASAARRRGEEYFSSGDCSGARAPAGSSIPRSCSFPFPRAGATTCCAPWSISVAPATGPIPAQTKPWRWFDPSNSRMARGCWRTHIRAPSTSTSRTATAGPAGGTRCARCGCSGGASRDGRAVVGSGWRRRPGRGDWRVLT